MEDMEQKLGAILSNPDMMQQIMTMAQALGQTQQAPSAPAPPPQTAPEASESAVPALDPAAIGKLASLAGQASIDRNQQALLKALKPYLSSQRIDKLEKAMRAAKLAKAASFAVNSGALSFLSGR